MGVPKAKRRTRRPATKHRALLTAHRHLYDPLFEEQQGVCGICRRPPNPDRKFDMDHDHKLMYIRGLLCVRCNRALVSWISPTWLRAAADYLDRAHARNSV